MIKFGFKKIISLMLCIVLLVTAVGDAKKHDRIELSGKESVLNIKNNFAVSAAEYLEKIASDFGGANGKLKLRKFIVDELKAAGYADEQIELQRASAFGVIPGKNIVLTVPGKKADKQIIVGGHYDGNGAGDNGSGVALILAAAVGLAGKIPACTVKYVFFDLEEIGGFGATSYAASMSEEGIKSTLFMVNVDSIAFGDYVCVYGGKQDAETGKVTQTGAYKTAMKYAETLGFNVYRTEKLDGYFDAHGTGPALDPKGVFTNPWTSAHPAPKNMSAVSPTTLPASDHVSFSELDIPYIYFEATNWFAEGKGDSRAYTGYYETYDTSIGSNGMFMNTKYDTIANLEKYFPGRAMEHFNIYSPLLSKLIMEATK